MSPDAGSGLAAGPSTGESLRALPGFLPLAGQLFCAAAAAAWRFRWRGVFVVYITAAAVLAVHQIDHPFMAWLATWRTPGLVQAAKFISLLGELHVLPLGVLLLLWAWAARNRCQALPIPLLGAFLAMVSGGILVQFLKRLFGRPRPHLPVPDQLDWFHAGWNSFPSGHSTHWCALLGALWLVSPRLALSLSPMAIIVMGARVLVPRHYPTDIVGGLVFGLLCGLCFAIAARQANLRYGRPARLSS